MADGNAVPICPESGEKYLLTNLSVKKIS